MLAITTDRFRQYLSQGKELVHNWRANREIDLGATVDHIELGDAHLTLGLNLAWHNKTHAPIEITDIQLRLYMSKFDDHPVRLYPNGRFAKIPGQKMFNKLPNVGSFVLEPDATHVEHLRFLTRAMLEIKEGNYRVEVLLHDARGLSYKQQATVALETKLKYRVSQEWYGN